MYYCLRAMQLKAYPELTHAKTGKPALVSESIILKAIAAAQQRDLNLDSCTCDEDVMEIVNDLRHKEQAELGRNPYAVLPGFSRSTIKKIVNLITPETAPYRCISPATRDREIRNARNTMPFAVLWNAVALGAPNGNFVHSWGECDVMLNYFGAKQPGKCNVAGKQKLLLNNTDPATTEMKQRRMFKIGLSKFPLYF